MLSFKVNQIEALQNLLFFVDVVVVCASGTWETYFSVKYFALWCAQSIYLLLNLFGICDLQKTLAIIYLFGLLFVNVFGLLDSRFYSQFGSVHQSSGETIVNCELNAGRGRRGAAHSVDTFCGLMFFLSLFPSLCLLFLSPLIPILSLTVIFYSVLTSLSFSLSLSACLPCCNHTAPWHCLLWPRSGCALLTPCTDPCQAVQQRRRNWSANCWCNPLRWTTSTWTTWSPRSHSSCVTNTTRTAAKQKRLRKIQRSTSYPFPRCHIDTYLASATTISPWRLSQFCRIVLRPPWHPLHLRLLQNANQQRRRHRVKYCVCSTTRNTTSMDIPSGCRWHMPIARLPWRHSTLSQISIIIKT